MENAKDAVTAFITDPALQQRLAKYLILCDFESLGMRCCQRSEHQLLRVRWIERGWHVMALTQVFF
jgi:hypothetical protein